MPALVPTLKQAWTAPDGKTRSAKPWAGSSSSRRATSSAGKRPGSSPPCAFDPSEHDVGAAAARIHLYVRYETDWLAELAAWEDRAMSAFAKAAHIRWKAKAIRESLAGVGIRGERAKRALDLFIAIGLLLVLAPLLLATAIAIKLDSRDPVFVRQRRAGRGERSFGLIKFRSMYAEAPLRRDELKELSGPSEDIAFSIRRDPPLPGSAASSAAPHLTNCRSSSMSSRET